MSFLKKSIFTAASQVVLMLLGLASGIIAARVLGPELKGKAALLNMLTQLLFMVCSLGLGSSFSFFIAKNCYKPAQIHTFAATSAFLLGLVGLACFYASLPLHGEVWQGIPAQLVFYCALLSIPFIYANYLTRIVVGYGRIYSMNIAGLANSFANCISLVIFLLILDYGLTGMVLSFWTSTLIQIAVLMYVLRTVLRPTSFWVRGLFRQALGYGIKSHGLLLINFLNYRIDMLLLKHFSNDTAVGYYSLAVTMAELMWLVPESSVAPLFAHVAKSESADRSLITMRVVRWSLVFLLLLSVAGYFFGQKLIVLLYGHDFLPAFQPFLWLIPGIILLPIFKLLAVDLSAQGHPGYGTSASLVALLVNIVANIYFIPKLGIIGAALATSISYSCMAALCLMFFLKISPYNLNDVILFDGNDRLFCSKIVSYCKLWKNNDISKY